MLFRLLEDFRAHRPLPCDDVGVIERVHHGHVFLLHHCFRGCERLVERIARKLDSHIRAAKCTHPLYLLPRSIFRHENDAARLQSLTAEGHPLRVIPC